MGHKKKKKDGHKAKKDDHKKFVHVPKNWRDKCYADHHWCAQWSDQMPKAQKVKLNCGKPLTWLKGDGPKAVKGFCKSKFPKATKQRLSDCFKAKCLIWAVRDHVCGRKEKRAANLASDQSGPGLEVYLGLGALLLVILGVIVAAWWYLGKGQKSGRQGAKGARKGSSKTGKSKLGKSKTGSRKSSHRSSRKRSQRSKGAKSRLSAKK